MRINLQLKVKWLLLVLTFLCCLNSGNAQAQSPTTPVTLNVTDAQLVKVLDMIEKQTTYLFVYNKNVDVTTMVSIKVAAKPLTAVLDQLLKSNNIVYAIENTSIVLSASTAKKEAADRKSVV